MSNQLLNYTVHIITKKHGFTLESFILAVIKSRWSTIASQWNNEKLFNIVGHYAAAKQGYITVNATEIDYEDINKSPNTSSDLSSPTTSNSQTNIINKFYDSLTSDQSLTTQVNNSSNTNESKNNKSSVIPPETESHSLTSMQQIYFFHLYGKVFNHYS